VSIAEADGSLNRVLNVGEPINSSYDDFSFIIDAHASTGYFSSNRVGGKGYDDIYSFIETKKIDLKPKQSLTGLITDADDNTVLSGAIISLSDEKFNIIKQVKTDIDGSYSFEVESESVYYVKVEKEGYPTKEQSITIPFGSGETKLSLSLGKVVRKVTLGSDLAKVFNIELIYFDLDKHNIRKDAEIDLEKIVDVMNQYPTMRIDVRSYTD